MNIVVSALLVGSLAAAPASGGIRSSLDAYVRTVTLPEPGPATDLPLGDCKARPFMKGVHEANEATARTQAVVDAVAWPAALLWGAIQQDVRPHRFPDISEKDGDAQILKCFHEGYAYQDRLNEKRRKTGSTIAGLILYALGGVLGYNRIRNDTQGGSSSVTNGRQADRRDPTQRRMPTTRRW